MKFLKPDKRKQFKINYGHDIEDAIEKISSIILKETEYPKERIRFIAIQYLLDNNQIYQEIGSEMINCLEPIKRIRKNLNMRVRERMELIRDKFIDDILKMLSNILKKKSNFYC